jgi:hypothetical protein
VVHGNVGTQVALSPSFDEERIHVSLKHPPRKLATEGLLANPPEEVLAGGPGKSSVLLDGDKRLYCGAHKRDATASRAHGWLENQHFVTAADNPLKLLL